MGLIRALNGGANVSSGGTSLSASTTNYFLIAQGTLSNSTTESNYQTVLRGAAVTARDLTVRITSNDRGASTARFRKNTANGNQSVSIGAGLTGVFTDSSNTDSVAVSDTIDFSLTVGSGGTVFRVSQFQCVFEGNGVATTFFSTTPNATTSDSTTLYVAPVAIGMSTTEANNQQLTRVALTQRGLRTRVNSNARTSTTTLKSRVGGADGNQSVSIGAGLTGVFEDTSNTDTIGLGVLFGSSVTTGTGAGELINFLYIVSQNDSANNHESHILGGPSTTVNASATSYFSGVGRFIAASAEADAKTPLRTQGTLSQLRVRVVTNGITASTTFRTRINGANGAQSVSIGSGLTGAFEDTSNSDTVAIGDDFNYQIVAGGSGTNMSIGMPVVLYEAIVVTENDVTKSAAYSVVTEHDTTKSAAYSVLSEHDITKAAAYELNIPTFTASPASDDFSDLTKTSSGHPAQGNVTFWYKRTSDTGITSLIVRVGSDSSNYTEVSFIPEADTDWHFISLPLNDGTTVGTPVWTAVDYLSVVVAKTTSSSIKIDDIRMTANGSFTMYELNSSIEFENARASFKKPTIFVDQIAKALSYTWFIDYERDIHFVSNETVESPFELDADTENFEDLVIDVDTSQLKNRQVVRGGTKETSSTYSQVVEGDNGIREWILKSLFKNLTIKLDDNTSTDTCEASTNTTTINATAHGLATGDWIVNRTRNAARQVTVVNANQFTVLEVTGQTSGDTFSKFATSKTVGVENIDDEASYDYMYNYNEKSIRASTQTETLPSGSFLLFTYNEVVPVRVQVSDNASIAALKALIGGDGIFDGQVITDTTLDSTRAAHDRAQAEINQYSNPIVKISFKTNYEGLESGQTIRVTDVQRGIDDVYLIQRVKTVYRSNDLPLFEVQCASTLFGIIEYFQKLSQSIGALNVSEDEVIDQVVSESVTITLGEVHDLNPSESASESATITLTETSNTATERNATSDPFEWGPTGSDNRWNLNQWG